MDAWLLSLCCKLSIPNGWKWTVLKLGALWKFKNGRSWAYSQSKYRHSVNFISRLSTIADRLATSCLMDDLFKMTVYFQIVQLSPHGRFNLTVLFKLDSIIKFMVHHETDHRTLTLFLDLPFGLRLGRSLSLEMSHNCTIRSRL